MINVPVRTTGRIAGAAYLLYFVTAVAAQTLQSDALNVIAYAFYAVLALMFYRIFKPVSRELSLIAALIALAGCATGVLAIFHFIPSAFSPLVFFGPYCLLIGYLIVRSAFLPKSIGALLMLAGLGWLIFLSPLGTALTIPIEELGILAEASLMLWLLVFGLNAERWSAAT
jgi:hypothetical protein